MDMNNPNYDISFIELRCKEVINASDGRKLGRITDLIFSNETGKIRSWMERVPEKYIKVQIGMFQ